LISAVVSALVIGTLSGASFQISGPTGAMTAVLIPISIKFGLPGILAAGFVSGILLIIAGFCKAGRVVNIIPIPVITGFTSGIAVIIALGQLEPFFGVTSKGAETLERLYHIFSDGFYPNLNAACVGAAVIAILLAWPQKWAARVPGSLAGIILAAGAAALLDLPVATVGDIPRTLLHETRLSLASFDALETIFSEPILVAGTSIAALGMIESLLCGLAGGRMKGEKLNVDRELVAQGIGNILLPFFGGVPATAAIARSSVAIKSGCRTRVTGLVQGGVLLLSMFLLGSLMSRIPLAALSGVLMVTAWRMNEWHSIRYIFGRRLRIGVAEFLLTLIATVVFDLTVAIAAGVFFSVIAFVTKVSELEVEVSEIDEKRLRRKLETNLHTQVVYVTGPIFFAAIERFESSIRHASADVLILSMRGVSYIDTSGAHALWNFCRHRKHQGVSILFAALQPRIRESLRSAGIENIVGTDAFFDNSLDAIASVEKRTLNQGQQS
jgi:SulP family sulfate permease